MQRLKRLGIAAAAFAVLAGCDRTPTATVCPAILYLTLSVTARDSVTGALVPNAVLKASPVTAMDSVVIGPDAHGYPAALATAPGTYVVTIRAQGYATWTGTRIVTTRDARCGFPDWVSVTAWMRPSS